jgi:hypothetical protein
MSQHSFYKGTVELTFDEAEHKYYTDTGSTLYEVPGVSTCCNMLDHSVYLMPWAAKMMANYLREHVEVRRNAIDMSWNQFDNLIDEAKTAHRRHFKEAGDIGNMAHEWLNRAIVAALAETDGVVHNMPEPGFDNEQAYNCGIHAHQWMLAHNVRWLQTERKVFSLAGYFAGTMDGLALVDSCSHMSCCPTWYLDERAIIDFKSSNHLRLEYLYQTAAYLEAWNEEFPEQSAATRWILRLGKEEGDFESWYTSSPDDLDQDLKVFHLLRQLWTAHRVVEARMALQKKVRKEAKKEEKTRGRKRTKASA